MKHGSLENTINVSLVGGESDVVGKKRGVGRPVGLRVWLTKGAKRGSRE